MGINCSIGLIRGVI